MGEHKVLVLNDVWFGYHLAAHAASNIYKGGLRAGWLVDLSLLFHQESDIVGFIKNILVINPKMRKELGLLCEMVLYLSGGLNDDQRLRQIKEGLFKGIAKRLNVQKHKMINIQEVANVSGVINKIRLVWREVFPIKEYMVYRYGKERLWRLYVKRLLRF